MLSSHTVYIVALLLLLSACSPAMQAETVDVQLRAKPAARTIVVNEAYNRRSVRLAVGDTLVVALPTNPGTSYSWQVVSRSKSVLARVGSTTKAKAVKSVRLGARKQKRFFFSAIKPGNARLRLVYRRPFEQAEPAATFEVHIRVKK
jgi:inhibitor of cysteine peptidase